MPGPLIVRPASLMNPSSRSLRVMFVTVCAESRVAVASSILLSPSPDWRMASRITDWLKSPIRGRLVPRRVAIVQ